MKRCVAALLLFAVALLPAVAGQPAAPKGEPRTYAVASKLVRKSLVTNSAGRNVMDTSELTMPELTTLEGTRGEYHTGGMLGTSPYGFKLQVEVVPAGERKVRLTISVEDSSAEGGGTPHVRAHSLRAVRIVPLGKRFTLDLHRGENGEGTTVELGVREAE